MKTTRCGPGSVAKAFASCCPEGVTQTARQAVQTVLKGWNYKMNSGSCDVAHPVKSVETSNGSPT
ncbi:unnamed protein product, partial [Amoebophrya sp. A120]|eukprot:GSA120T00023561001.1